MTRLAIGQRVRTEYGDGVVRESSARRVFLALDSGETLNVATGTPGYARIEVIGAARLLSDLQPGDVVKTGALDRYRFTVRQVYADGARDARNPKTGDHVTVYGISTSPTGRTEPAALYGWWAETEVETVSTEKET